jgi:hypothetical protein
MKEGGYKRLFERTAAWVNQVRNPETRPLWHIDNFNTAYDMQGALQQAITAQKAGWHLELWAEEDGSLSCRMVKNPGAPPV